MGRGLLRLEKVLGRETGGGKSDPEDEVDAEGAGVERDVRRAARRAGLEIVTGRGDKRFAEVILCSANLKISVYPTGVFLNIANHDSFTIERIVKRKSPLTTLYPIFHLLQPP